MEESPTPPVCFGSRESKHKLHPAREERERFRMHESPLGEGKSGAGSGGTDKSQDIPFLLSCHPIPEMTLEIMPGV